MLKVTPALTVNLARLQPLCGGFDPEGLQKAEVNKQSLRKLCTMQYVQDFRTACANLARSGRKTVREPQIRSDSRVR